VSICFVILCAFSWAGHYFIGKHLEQEVADVDAGLTASYSMPSDRYLRNAQFTITNNSYSDINLIALGCGVSGAVFEGDNNTSNGINGVILAEHVGVTIHANGDHESFTCPQGTVTKSPRLVCADITVIATYSIKDQAHQSREKRYRYALFSGNKDWTPIALEDPPTSCRWKPK
jgi:hypothetical protein